MKSRVNRKLRLLKALCQFLIVGFEDGCYTDLAKDNRFSQLILFLGIEEPLDLADGGR